MEWPQTKLALSVASEVQFYIHLPNLVSSVKTDNFICKRGVVIPRITECLGKQYVCISIKARIG